MKMTERAAITEKNTQSVISNETRAQIRQIIESTRGEAGALIRVLQKTQSLIGYLPVEALEIVSESMQVSISEVYGIVSFYSFFSLVPKGKHVISVCLGTACYVKGGEKILSALAKDTKLEPGGITEDKKFSLQTVRCLGCCGLSPVMAIGEDVYRRVRPSEVKNILASYE